MMWDSSLQFPAKNWRMRYFVSLVTTRSIRSRINNFLVLDLFHCLDLLFCFDLFCCFTLSFVRSFVVQTFTFVAFFCFTHSRSTFSQLISFPFLRCLSVCLLFQTDTLFCWTLWIQKELPNFSKTTHQISPSSNFANSLRLTTQIANGQFCHPTSEFNYVLRRLMHRTTAIYHSLTYRHSLYRRLSFTHSPCALIYLFLYLFRISILSSPWQRNSKCELQFIFVCYLFYYLLLLHSHSLLRSRLNGNSLQFIQQSSILNRVPLLIWPKRISVFATFHQERRSKKKTKQ